MKDVPGLHYRGDGCYKCKVCGETVHSTPYPGGKKRTVTKKDKIQSSPSEDMGGKQ